MTLKFSPNAEEEYFNILSYYFEVEKYEGHHDLTERFKIELFRSFKFIESFPTATQTIYKNRIKRLNLQKFPFYVLYEIVDDTIRILAIPHQKSNPKTMKEFLGKTTS